jgi:hypothetical protein
MASTPSGFIYPDPGYTSGWRQGIEDLADSAENVILEAGTPRYADAAARTTAIPSPVLGMRSVLTSTEITYRYNGSAWKEWDSDWITWTTTPTGITIGTGGSASTLQRYKYITGRCLFYYKFTLGTSGASVGTAPYLTLPFSLVPPTTRYATLPGDGSTWDSSANSQNYTKARINDTTANQALLSTYTGTYANITATAPWTWAAGDQLGGEFWGDPA